MTGRVGNGVFSIEEGGTGLRQYNGVSKQPFTDSQRAREAAFTKANQTWPTIGIPAATAWRNWGKKQLVKTVSGRTRSREGKDCFVGLYAKMLQVNPMVAVPLVPPVSGLVPQSVVVSLSIVAQGAKFTGSAANSPGYVTELMAQEIRSEVALPSKQYGTLGFFAYKEAGDSTTLPTSPGYWSFATQFVEIATGRATGFQVLGTALVGLSMVEGGADEATSAPATEKKAA